MPLPPSILPFLDWFRKQPFPFHLFLESSIPLVSAGIGIWNQGSREQTQQARAAQVLQTVVRAYPLLPALSLLPGDNF